MPTNEQRRDEVRKIIVSLLLARPGATKVTVLDRDYYEVEGKRIPWREFGYADIVEFLKSMPEHCAVEWCNGGHQVRGFASEKTKHVSSLVSRQKCTAKKYIAPQFRRPFVSRHIPQMQRQRIRIPADQLSTLVKHVKNNPNGVTQRSAWLMMQKLLPHSTFSIHDMQEQLRELSHSLYLDGDMIYPMPVKNDVSQEVKNYPQSSTLKPQNMPRSPATGAVYVGGDEGSDFIDFSDEDNFVPVDYANSNYQPKQPKTSERLAASFAWNANNEQHAMFNYNDDVEIDEYFAANNDADTKTAADYVDVASLISDRTKSRLDQLMREHPDGIWCADLPEKYLKAYNVHLNYNELGFTSVREYASYLPNIFYMTRANSTDDFILYSADKRPIPDQESASTEHIEIRPNSREQYDEHNTVRIQSGDDDDNAPIPADVPPTITQIFAPDDVMNYNDSVDQILVTDLQRDRKYLEVYIVEMFHPTFFWIHLRENKKRFDIFMDDLDTFYENNKDKYTIPKIALKKGLNCACTYSGRWHRGIIKSVKPDFRVTVMFYDYGTLKTYAAEDVYYLHKEFSFLPAQAIPCGLYNVRPCVGDRWKRSVKEQMIDKINETLLALTIISVDPSNNSMMVILSDTSEEEDVHINDWLVNEKLAQCGKMGDAVDMASLMKYVVNNMNQLPTYCYAEENLMSDSRCKSTSTEETPETVLLVSSEQSHQCCDGLEQRSMRPPPGFAPLGKKSNLSNVPTRSFNDMYSFGNTSNAKTSSHGNTEVTTNPFLSDEESVNDNVIPKDIAKQIFMAIWSENMQLFVKCTEILYDMLEHSPPNRNIFENHMTLQHHLNKFLKMFEEALIPDSDQSTSSASLNLAKETTDKVGSAQKINTPINSNAESFVNQKLAGMNNLSSNPFGDDRPPQNHTTFSASNGHTFATNWHRSDGFSPRVQPSLLTPASACSANYVSSATNVFFPNSDQNSEIPISPAMKPVFPVISMNADVSNNNRNLSSFFTTTNSEFANVFKETNPFRFSMTDNMQIPETQSEPSEANSYDTNPASYLSVKNLQDHSLKMEALNIHAGNNSFTAAEHVNVNGTECYTPRIVYEAGPVMYNAQKKQTDEDVKQNACNSNFKNDRNVSLKRRYDDKELPSQSANDITISYSKHESSHIDEGYVTRPPTDYTLQNSPPIISGEAIYHQQNVNANERVSAQAWKEVEIPERWVNSQLRNGVPLQNHNEKSTTSTSINFSSHKDWNCDNNRESITRGMSEVADLSYIFQWNDKERATDIYKNYWNYLSYIENQKFTQYNNVNSDFFLTSLLYFRKLVCVILSGIQPDSIKNVSFIFHTEGEGWMLTHEFVETFTNLKLCSRLIATIEAMNIKVVFKEIHRSEYPVQFLQLDHYLINVPRDSNKRIVSINLISLQAALSLLHKLKIVTREEIDNAFKKREFINGSILPNMWTLIVVYRDLKRRIEQYATYGI